MKTFFWTSLFWLFAVAGFLGYLKWFNADLAANLTSYIVQQSYVQDDDCLDFVVPVPGSGTLVPLSGNISEYASSLELKIDEMKAQLREINEKLELQNSYTPDAVSLSLRTTKKTSIFVWPFDGSEYKKYTMNPSEDILKDTLNILFDKSAFILKSTQLDNDGLLTIVLERNRTIPFGGSAMVEQVTNSITKTATQFAQIKSVKILPEEVLQP